MIAERVVIVRGKSYVCDEQEHTRADGTAYLGLAWRLWCRSWALRRKAGEGRVRWWELAESVVGVSERGEDGGG